MSLSTRERMVVGSAEEEVGDDSNAIDLFNICLNRQLSLDTMSGDDEPLVNDDSVLKDSLSFVSTASTDAKDINNDVAPRYVDECDEEAPSLLCATSDSFKENMDASASKSTEIGGGDTIDEQPSDALQLEEDETNLDNDDVYEEDEDEKLLESITQNMCLSGWNALHVMYLSLFSVLGVSMRWFMGRFFGGDCESNAQGNPINDFLWPLSHKICVTADGLTEQYGGALFIDLPANMFGSFLMGYFTGHNVDWPVMPCLSHAHPWQQDKGLHLGIRTALCGSFTTFSSWNSQMVLMMDGTANPYLGSQVLSALFGYILGYQAAASSFRAGRTLSAWVHSRRNPYIFDSNLEKSDHREKRHYKHLGWLTPLIVFTLFALLICLYVAGDLYWGIAYYRQVWIACLACPIGTILRWKLGSYNGKFGYPTGTFLANLLASILSAGLTAWAIIESLDKGAQRWEIPAIKAVSLGVAGSLSTVSTFVKESVEMTEKNPHFDKKSFLYSHGTMVICCFAGLAIYSPLVRYAPRPT